MTDLTIRPATPRDLIDIMAMIRDLSRFHGDTATVTLEALQDVFFGALPRATAYLACSGDAVVGYAGITHRLALHQAAPRFDLHHLYVVDGHRNRGIGRALIATARDMARTKEAKGLTIGTDAKNITAQAAYRAMGLEEITDAGPRFWIPAAAESS